MAEVNGVAILEHLGGMAQLYRVRSHLEYIDDKYEIDVLPGWITDGASVPKLFWNIVSPFSGRYVEAAIIHDALYRSEALPRSECDLIFLRAMKAMGTPAWKRWLMYAGVRIGGWAVWREHHPVEVNKFRKRYIRVKQK